MELYRSGDIIDFDGCAVALGEFDGLHVAHMEIIRQTINSGLVSGIMYFSDNPKGDLSMLMSENQKLDMLEICDFVYIQDFDESFKNKSCEEFVDFLVGCLHAEAVYVGYNYRFGKNAAGDVHTLKKLGDEYGFSVCVISEVKNDGEQICSSKIRQYIKDGEMDRAFQMLGRHYSIDGTVIKGKQNGRKMGFPTINVDYDNRVTLPKFGVYAGFTNVGGKKYKSVINVGNNPTFDADKISVESHLIGFDGELYDEYADVEFVEFIRNEMKFNSSEDLSKQISNDYENAKRILK